LTKLRSNHLPAYAILTTWGSRNARSRLAKLLASHAFKTPESVINGRLDIASSTSEIRLEAGIHRASVGRVVAAPVGNGTTLAVEVVKKSRTTLIVGEIRRIVDDDVELVDSVVVLEPAALLFGGQVWFVGVDEIPLPGHLRLRVRSDEAGQKGEDKRARELHIREYDLKMMKRRSLE
jgi:hypothetical protein